MWIRVLGTSEGVRRGSDISISRKSFTCVSYYHSVFRVLDSHYARRSPEMSGGDYNAVGRVRPAAPARPVPMLTPAALAPGDCEAVLSLADDASVVAGSHDVDMCLLSALTHVRVLVAADQVAALFADLMDGRDHLCVADNVPRTWAASLTASGVRCRLRRSYGHSGPIGPRVCVARPV